MIQVLITGANGQLGNEFRLLAKDSNLSFIFTDVAELDITNSSAIELFLTQNKNLSNSFL